MRYPIEVRERRYVKSYQFLYLTKNVFENVAVHVLKNFMIKQKKRGTDAFKTASKRAIEKTAEATGDFIRNKSSDKIVNRLKDSKSSATVEISKDFEFNEN